MSKMQRGMQGAQGLHIQASGNMDLYMEHPNRKQSCSEPIQRASACRHFVVAYMVLPDPTFFTTSSTPSPTSTAGTAAPRSGSGRLTPRACSSALCSTTSSAPTRGAPRSNWREPPMRPSSESRPEAPAVEEVVGPNRVYFVDDDGTLAFGSGVRDLDMDASKKSKAGAQKDEIFFVRVGVKEQSSNIHLDSSAGHLHRNLHLLVINGDWREFPLK
ncbi:hypothetical protein TRIUR3_29189 [Triticum urartu]|uniref:Uncharacterized protein n=1 Tax=Triticum urartu TaxID=4572 RepID=M7YW02_TRIUA|nr:hypothetical protein TRIUR3_29189 [Triticum urartu]